MCGVQGHKLKLKLRGFSPNSQGAEETHSLTDSLNIIDLLQG